MCSPTNETMHIKKLYYMRNQFWSQLIQFKVLAQFPWNVDFRIEDNIQQPYCFLEFRRNYKEVLASSEGRCPANTRSTESDLSQKVLDSLFKVPKSPAYEPKTMNWRNVAKKLQSMGPLFDVSPSSNSEAQQDFHGITRILHSVRFCFCFCCIW